ncbi:DJ-1/PfpI family protein [Glonium stellatum]|uniref:DJ-1/PfpI family protein n=1 Tax=Glonium stellatum TaxID=574774 RepID=A0A8E2JXG2_9PEZI|nr:DJ-1/PfpI family protein [Glonium stellatum]
MAPLKIGVMLEKVQLSDITCIDLIGNLSTEYVKVLAGLGYAEYLQQAIDMEFLYISSSLELAFMTPSMHVKPTVTYDDCPRDLDILVIGGPPPTHRPEASLKFMKEAAEKTKVVLTTCIGSAWLASAGVLDGKKATTNREFLPIARQMHPDVEWLDQRWVVDGKFWTAGGAGAGNDMVAAYALQTWDEKFVKTVSLNMLDMDPASRGQFYK